MASIGTEVAVVSNQAKGRTSIGVSRQTRDNLNSIRHTGQSYSGLIQELVEFWKAKRVSTRPREPGEKSAIRNLSKTKKRPVSAGLFSRKH